MSEDFSFFDATIGGAVTAAIILGAGTIASSGSIDVLIPKAGAIQDALNKGVSEEQLRAAFKEVVPEIAKRELEKLADLCKGNEALLSSRGIDCSKVVESFKPQGPS
jgi:hypothetical protein